METLLIAVFFFFFGSWCVFMGLVGAMYLTYKIIPNKFENFQKFLESLNYEEKE